MEYIVTFQDLSLQVLKIIRSFAVKYSEGVPKKRGISRYFYLSREGRVIQRAEIIPMNLIRVMPAEGKSYNTRANSV